MSPVRVVMSDLKEQMIQNHKTNKRLVENKAVGLNVTSSLLIYFVLLFMQTVIDVTMTVRIEVGT